jgi:hypothetical protein
MLGEKPAQPNPVPGRKLAHPIRQNDGLARSNKRVWLAVRDDLLAQVIVKKRLVMGTWEKEYVGHGGCFR